MDRARLDRLAETATGLVHDVFSRVFSAVVKTSGETELANIEVIRHMVATALVAVGVSILKEEGSTLVDVGTIVSDAWGKDG